MARIGNGTCGRPSNTVGARNVLTHHISTQLREREGKALTNFSRARPAEDSDLTRQILKDPYSFEFLTLSSSAKERELERGLLKHLRDLLLARLPLFAAYFSKNRIFGTCSLLILLKSNC
jgi:hypothetical protein